VTRLIRISALSLNNWDCEKWGNCGHLAGVGIGFWGLEFLGEFQRRGVHVSTPKNGSRGAEKCFGGIQRFYAELRREFFWENWDLMFFWVFFGFPRGDTEEGGDN
jgi:hypothetical protein